VRLCTGVNPVQVDVLDPRHWGCFALCIVKIQFGVNPVEDSGQAAYRVMLTRDQMESDPELLQLVNSKCSYRWIGPKRMMIVRIQMLNSASTHRKQGLPYLEQYDLQHFHRPPGYPFRFRAYDVVDYSSRQRRDARYVWRLLPRRPKASGSCARRGSLRVEVESARQSQHVGGW
jgi:hypothetical protein